LTTSLSRRVNTERRLRPLSTRYRKGPIFENRSALNEHRRVKVIESITRRRWGLVAGVPLCKAEGLGVS